MEGGNQIKEGRVGSQEGQQDWGLGGSGVAGKVEQKVESGG